MNPLCRFLEELQDSKTYNCNVAGRILEINVQILNSLQLTIMHELYSLVGCSHISGRKIYSKSYAFMNKIILTYFRFNNRLPLRY